MIEQIRTYRVTCDGLVMKGSGVSQCRTTCNVQATHKAEALQHLPIGWELNVGLRTICPHEHYQTKVAD